MTTLVECFFCLGSSSVQHALAHLPVSCVVGIPPSVAVKLLTLCNASLHFWLALLLHASVPPQSFVDFLPAFVPTLPFPSGLAPETKSSKGTLLQKYPPSIYIDKKTRFLQILHDNPHLINLDPINWTTSDILQIQVKWLVSNSKSSPRD